MIENFQNNGAFSLSVVAWAIWWLILSIPLENLWLGWC